MRSHKDMEFSKCICRFPLLSFRCIDRFHLHPVIRLIQPHIIIPDVVAGILFLQGIQLQRLKIHQTKIPGLWFLPFRSVGFHDSEQLIQAVLAENGFCLLHIQDAIFPIADFHRGIPREGVCVLEKKSPPSPVPVMAVLVPLVSVPSPSWGRMPRSSTYHGFTLIIPRSSNCRKYPIRLSFAVPHR